MPAPAALTEAQSMKVRCLPGTASNHSSCEWRAAWNPRGAVCALATLAPKLTAAPAAAAPASSDRLSFMEPPAGGSEAPLLRFLVLDADGLERTRILLRVP